MRNEVKLYKSLKVAVLTVCIIYLCALTVKAQDTDAYYSNDLGLELTEEEYEYATQYVDDIELKFFTREDFDYVFEDFEKHHVGSDSVVFTETANDYKLTYSLNSISDWSAIHTTSMKKLTMDAYYTQGAVIKITLRCTWTSIPKIKSYDVIGMAVSKGCGFTFNTPDNSNIQGYQIYDGNEIYYSHSSDNMKDSITGVGLSTNISDNVTNTLIVELAANLVVPDNVTFYGSYQHAISNVTLSQSQKYTFSTSGMGNVFNFSNSVKNKYDNMQGVCVSIDWEDIE